MKVSVITVVYNNAKKIERAIKSVINQTYGDIEYIVVDGGSTDGTLAIIKRYQGYISKWISEPDEGIYDAFNKGIRLSSGDIVAFLNSDDVYANEKVIEKVVNKFQESEAGGVYGDLVYTDQGGRIVRYWKAGEYRRELLKRGWMPPHPTLFLKKRIYQDYGLYRTDMKISSDYDICLRLLWRAGIRIAYIPEVLVVMERGGMSNRSLLNRMRAVLEDYIAIRDSKVGGIGTLLLKKFTKVGQFVKLNTDV